MQKSVDAAEVDECSEFSDIRDSSLDDVAFLDLGQEIAACIFAFDFDQLATADDDVASFEIDLQYSGTNRAANEVADIAWTANIDLRCRQENWNPDVDQKSALDLAKNFSFDNIAFLLRLQQQFPTADAISFALRENNVSVLIFDFFQENIDIIAGRYAAGIIEFFLENLSFAFQSDIDDDIIAADGHDASFDDAVRGADRSAGSGHDGG